MWTSTTRVCWFLARILLIEKDNSIVLSIVLKLVQSAGVENNRPA